LRLPCPAPPWGPAVGPRKACGHVHAPRALQAMGGRPKGPRGGSPTIASPSPAARTRAAVAWPWQRPPRAANRVPSFLAVETNGSAGCAHATVFGCRTPRHPRQGTSNPFRQVQQRRHSAVATKYSVPKQGSWTWYAILGPTQP
jgi:hypothetical protein